MGEPLCKSVHNVSGGLSPSSTNAKPPSSDARLTSLLGFLAGVLRLGVWVDTGAEWGSSWMWRHWGCVTDRQLANISLVVGGQASGLKGWDALDSEDQHIVQTALNRGRSESYRI